MNKAIAPYTFIVSAFILLFFAYTTYKDVLFFSTKKTTTGIVLSKVNNGVQRPFEITVRYFNTYLAKEIECSIAAKKSYGRNINVNDSIKIDYGEKFPENIYLTDFKSPIIGILLFDVFIIVAMFFSCLFALKTIISLFKSAKLYFKNLYK